MDPYIVKVKSVQHITHDVLKIVTERPADYKFTPGQATKISINKEGWQTKKRPFTFTSLPADEYLEFTIKTYPLHEGVTNELLNLDEGDELILHEVFGAIAYKAEGVFIGGGAGVTPFISIFRYLDSVKKIGNNKLIFANKTKSDIILEKEFNSLLGDHFINILSDENLDGYAHGLITESLLKKHINTSIRDIYVCGPPPMMTAIEQQLADLRIEENQIIKEVF